MDAQRTRKLILLADDSPTQARRTADALEAAGYRVHMVADGREALQEARRWRPDLILSDILMPIMDGFALCRTIRRDPDIATTPLILHTATFLAPEDESFAVALGATRFILKPDDPAELVAVVREVLNGVVAPPTETVLIADDAFIRGYSERLAAKLEQTVVELRLANRNLAAKNQELVTVAHENERLYHEAQDAVHLQEEFLSIAAHELRTPLSALLGYVQLLQRRAADGRSPGEVDRRAVDVIAEQSTRLARLVEVLLDLSRIDSGSMKLDRAPLDLRSLTYRIVEEVRATLHATPRHEITMTNPETPQIVDGDELRLEQAIRNLLQNAVKYSPAGGTIAVDLVDEADQIVLDVHDSGIGIPTNDQPHIFRRFYRSSNALNENMAGFGIGLYIVDQIIRQHGGSVAVRSHDGEGSTFTVRLPHIGVGAGTSPPAQTDLERSDAHGDDEPATAT